MSIEQAVDIAPSNNDEVTLKHIESGLSSQMERIKSSSVSAIALQKSLWH